MNFLKEVRITERFPEFIIKENKNICFSCKQRHKRIQINLWEIQELGSQAYIKAASNDSTYSIPAEINGGSSFSTKYNITHLGEPRQTEYITSHITVIKCLPHTDALAHAQNSTSSRTPLWTSGMKSIIHF